MARAISGTRSLYNHTFFVVQTQKHSHMFCTNASPFAYSTYGLVKCIRAHKMMGSCVCVCARAHAHVCVFMCTCD